MTNITTAGIAEPDVARRFWEKVDRSGRCWTWTAAKYGNGYGVFYVNSGARSRLAHRVSFELAHGAIDTDLVIDHLCRNILCVRPDHLEQVTGRENTLRGIGPAAVHASATRCIRGHDLTGSNVYHYTKASGLPARQCRTCTRASKARWDQANRKGLSNPVAHSR